MLKTTLGALVGLVACVPLAGAQSVWVDRLPADEFDVMSPAERVRGEPGAMQVLNTACEAASGARTRQRIVDVALQEWAYFGFSVADETREPEPGSNPFGGGRERRSFRSFTWLDLEQSMRLAGSIAGYWAITGDGSWIVNRQNEVWDSSGVGARWRDPWSAAFISWVMCESGLGDNSSFDRAIAHHTYIDQAIRARDAGVADTAYLAYDVGEQPVEAGDLVCSARRPTYSSLSERRRQLGNGIRSHCDIVIKLEPEHDRLLAVGGNVRGSVSLKLLPADFLRDREGRVEVEQIGRGRDRVFAHLKLRAEPVADDPFRLSPTLRHLAEEPELVDRVRAVLDRAVSALSASVFL